MYLIELVFDIPNLYKIGKPSYALMRNNGEYYIIRMIHIGLKGVLLLTLIAFVSRSLPYSSLTPIWTPHNQLYAGTATIASVIMVSPPSSP